MAKDTFKAQGKPSAAGVRVVMLGLLSLTNVMLPTVMLRALSVRQCQDIPQVPHKLLSQHPPVSTSTHLNGVSSRCLSVPSPLSLSDRDLA